MSPKDKDKTDASWREKSVTLPGGLLALLLSSALSAGGVKLADNAWPTEVEVRLALIEKQQQESRAILLFLAEHHGVDPVLLRTLLEEERQP